MCPVCKDKVEIKCTGPQVVKHQQTITLFVFFSNLRHIEQDKVFLGPVTDIDAHIHKRTLIPMNARTHTLPYENL